MIEPLEPRIAPATFTVTSLADDGGGDLRTLREAIDLANAAPGADTIVFGGAAAAGGTIELVGQLVINYNVAIKGPGAGKLILDGNNATNIFVITDSAPTVRSVSISGLSIVDGNAGASGGGGIFTAESLTLSNVVISSCTTSGNGGGVHANTPGKVVIKSSLITGNVAGGTYGGGLFLSALGGVQVTGSTIGGNAAPFGGGIVALIDTIGTGDVLIESSKILGNSASLAGGGALLSDARQVRGVDVGKVIVRDSLISGNAAGAAYDGGGLDLQRGFVTIERCQVSNNSAGRGGGIFGLGTTLLTLTGTKLTANHALATGEAGGGLHAVAVTRTVIQSSTILGNTSAGDGGGFAFDGGTALVRGSTIAGNVAAADGGGGGGFRGVALTVERSSFLDNRAGISGGGLRTEGTGASAVPLTVKSSLFQGNNSAGAGGGGLITSGDGTVAITGSRLIGNVALGSGGGAALTSSAAIVITGGTVSHNAAGGGGGLSLSGTGAKSILGTVIRDNLAYASVGTGGGIALVNGSLSLSKTTSVMYNAADIGGGITNFTAIPVALHGAKVVFNTAITFPQIFGAFTP